MKKCPVCESNKINIADCGYITFNRGFVECKDCGFKINYKNLNSENDFKDSWNRDINYMEQLVDLNEKDKNSLLISLFLKDTIAVGSMIEKINKLNEGG